MINTNIKYKQGSGGYCTHWHIGTITNIEVDGKQLGKHGAKVAHWIAKHIYNNTPPSLLVQTIENAHTFVDSACKALKIKRCELRDGCLEIKAFKRK